VWTFALYWYQIYNNFDCTYLYDYTYIILFNLAFTSLPVILMGVLDQDVDDQVSLAVPQLYRRGIERKEWTQPKFWFVIAFKISLCISLANKIYRVYMFDGLYQSVLIFFSAYCLFSSSRFESSNGLNIDDTNRIGVFVAGTAVVVANTYILFNTYRWDWLTLLIVFISTLLFWFWTGVWTAFTNADFFYQAAPQVFGQLNFWALLLVVTIICLIPRFVIKSIQKIYFPRDVDIIREQVAQGKFDYLKDSDGVLPANPEKVKTLDSSSDSSQAQRRRAESHVTDDMRPIYPPSTTHTATTHARPNGSDGTEYSGHPETPTNRTRPSAEMAHISREHSRVDAAGGLGRPSFDRSRTSFDRTRASMDRVRPSYEQSADFTSAALLTRLESSNSGYKFNRKSTVPEE
jgi:phospholipid-translocating ATPase